MDNEKRLIDALTLAEEIESIAITVAGKPARWNDAKHSVLRMIAEQADVDAVEVVRCKDCKYYVPAPYYALDHDDPTDTKICRSPNLDYDTECGDQWMWMRPDDFCSYGERKTK